MNIVEEHMKNVYFYSLLLGHNLGLSKSELTDLSFAARLHDVGKVKIPKEILYKRGRLTVEEMEIIKQHPKFSASILRFNGFNSTVVTAALHHHERFDGFGYPDHLKGEDIPLLSRIISIADTFDAITSDRPYSTAKSFEFAVEEIISNAGYQFDPELVKCFQEIVPFYLNIDRKIESVNF